MYCWPADMGHQVSVEFSTNITISEFFGAILDYNKAFLSTFCQLTDSTSWQNLSHMWCNLCWDIVPIKKCLVNIKRKLR